MAASLPELRVKSKIFVQVSEEESKRAEQDEAFLRAVESGDLAAVKAFDRCHLDLNVADEFRNSAVHKAMRHGKDILEYLTSRGAYPEFVDSEGARPIAHAIRLDNTAAVEHLLSLKVDDGRHRVELLQTISKSGNSLLHEAAWFDRPESATLLIATGAFDKEALERSNNAGQTAVHVASFRSTVDLIQVLAEAGASVDTSTTSSRHMKETPVQMASSMGKEANAKYIQELGIAINAIKFASRIRRRKNAKKPAKAPEQKAGAEPESPVAVMTIRFDFDFKIFTADLEKAFIVKLAKHVDVPPEQLVVLSRVAGSVILEIGVKGQANTVETAMSAFRASTLESISAALGYIVLDRSVGRCKTKEAVPDYSKATELQAAPIKTAEAEAASDKASVGGSSLPSEVPPVQLPGAVITSASDGKLTRESPRRSTPGYNAIEQVAQPGSGRVASKEL